MVPGAGAARVRDDATLSANPHLWSSIRDALDESQWFVLLASPDAAASSWVDRELRHWLATKPVERILVAVTDGECHWDRDAGQLSGNAAPIAITEAFEDEPRLVDLRWAHTADDLDMRNPRFRDAAAQLAAPAHGVAKDELDSEDLRLQRRARRLAQGATTMLVLLVLVSLTLGGLARQQRNEAQRAQAAAEAESLRSDAQRLGTQALTEPNLDRSLLLAVAGVDLADLPESRGDLLAVLQKTPAVIRHVVASHNEIVALRGQSRWAAPRLGRFRRGGALQRSPNLEAERTRDHSSRAGLAAGDGLLAGRYPPGGLGRGVRYAIGSVLHRCRNSECETRQVVAFRSCRRGTSEVHAPCVFTER